ncbi:TonB-dependent receptor [Opitutia bacterium ISCC 51]|nr:TonB-dependent receptor [Opitutae bacterium ISCC 51]QXD28133.1 TonB-dependent receptor [Opitutae bacterium ISCC 52]
MKPNVNKLLRPALLMGLLLMPVGLFAQQTGTISGTVSDSSANLNLEGVIVSVSGTSIDDVTDGSGRYTLRNVPVGNQTVDFSYVGLDSISRTVNVSSSDRTFLNLDMAQEVVDLSEMQIYGSLIGQSRAINLQKTSATLKNVVASDAFGRFPDQNAAEILGRLPGVSVELDQGEGRYVIIRGIDPDLNNISINGVSLPSPESNTRRVAMDVVPSDILDTLEVTKSVTPDMDGDTIGGNVNIKTKSAFDYGDQVLQGTVQGQYSDLIDEYSYKVNATYGDVFSDGTVGWITSISYQEREFGSDNREVDGPWSLEDGPNGEFFFAPEIEFREYLVTRERLGISSALEFQPSEDQFFYIRGIFNEFSDQEYRYRSEVKFEDGDIVALGDRTASVEGTAETDRDIKDRYEEQTIYSLSAGGEVESGDWTHDFQIAYSFAEEAEPNRLDTDFRSNEDLGQNYSYDLRDPYNPIVTYDGGDAGADPFEATSFLFDGLAVEDNITDETEFALQYNARKEMDFGGNPGFFKFGAKYREKSKESDLTLFENDSEPSDFTLFDFVDFSRYPYFNGNQGGYLRGDGPGFRRFFESNRSGFEMELNDEDSDIEDYQSDEDILAGYFMAGVTQGNWDWTAGVRVERTEFSSTGLEAVFDDEGDYDSGASQTITASKDYTDILPGIHGKFQPDDERMIRLSLNKSLARPKFSDSANRRIVDLTDGEEIVQGNPDLDPYQAWNLDLSYEHYLPNLGIFSVSGFAKKIDDFVYVSKSEIANPDDPSSEVDFINFRNGETADVLGVEFSYIQPIQAIDGVSVYTNLTFVDSEADFGSDADRDGSLTIPFPGTSDTLGTLALTYEKSGFFIRVAGTYRDDYLQAIGGDTTEDEFIRDHFQWDLSTSYTFNDNWTLFLEVVNFNDEPFQAYYGSDSRMRQMEEYSWFANFGVKWNL